VRSRTASGILSVVILTMLPWTAVAQLGSDDIEALSRRGAREGWTFRVGPTPATHYPSDVRGGWRSSSIPPTAPRIARRKEALPARFDWREVSGCPAVRDQGNCGSCWAFATIGVLECAIMNMDGVEANLSEQWLVSCNDEGWGCSGGTWAFDYLEWKEDPCSEMGAVPERQFQYQAADMPCGCPYNHTYFIDAWGYVDAPGQVADTQLLKQAIHDDGPVAVAIHTSDAFAAYTDGVFNACEDGECDHAVLLVGWDDALGTAGAWILRNSWSEDWGEAGYMYIEYGCSRVGTDAAYAVYMGDNDLKVSPATSLNASGPEGGPFSPASVVYALKNDGDAPIEYTVSSDADWTEITAPGKGTSLGPLTLAPGATAEVSVGIGAAASALDAGCYWTSVQFNNEDSARARKQRVYLRVGDVDFLAEKFEREEFDLEFLTFRLTPDDSFSGYAVCSEPAYAFPVDPAPATEVALEDDDFVRIPLADGRPFAMFGTSYTDVFIGSNGYVTFGEGDTGNAWGGAEAFFSHPRIALVEADLWPAPEEGAPGRISYVQLQDRFVVTYENVPDFDGEFRVNLQLALWFDGRIELTYLDWTGTCAPWGYAGLSRGEGESFFFSESDFSASDSCSIRLDTPNGGEVWTAGSLQTIVWHANEAIVGPSVRLALHEGMRFLEWITLRTANDGARAWRVPLDLSPNLRYRIRVQSFDDPVLRDYSDMPFYVTPATLALTSPDGGETWRLGSVQTIAWASDPSVGNLVRLALHQGRVFDRWIARRTANDGAFNWIVPKDLDPDVRYTVRVQAYTNPALRDFSNAPFAVETE